MIVCKQHMTFSFTVEISYLIYGEYLSVEVTLNDRLNALGVYFKIQNFKGAFN